MCKVTLWETKQREREIKHSRVSDLTPLNAVMLMHSGVGIADVHRVLCSLVLSAASVVSLLREVHTLIHTLILINICLIT